MKIRTEIVAIFLITMMLFYCPASVGQVQLPDANTQATPRQLTKKAGVRRVRLKTTVDDQLLKRFQQGQSIVVKVPAGREKSVSSLVVQKPECFKPESVTVRPRTRVNGDTIMVDVSKQLFDRLDYQPIRIKSNWNASYPSPVIVQ